ncbi:tetratricopeptide repeat protein [Stappia indica]|uniref:Tetratricopeptide repeat protein n=1 Tax=Stappia indica TaxID=538381 RepID=A0A857CAJ3_9HYPH|nr:tetratricopeptide repeat protein [Stappia indica]QGZ36044.1 tetratricopeptide repeat protein [Stappia indica]
MPSTRHALSRPAAAPRLMLAASMVALVALTGCASSKRAVGTHSGAPQGYAAPGSSAALQAVGYWGQAYQRSPKDRENILNYAAALRRNGQVDQAEAVLRQAIIAHQSDRDIAAAYGKVLAMNGRLPEALQVINGAQTPTRPDWRLMSAAAAIHDQMGNTQQARELYNQALKIAPDEPSLLNNLAMSYLLQGEAKEAEGVLRRATASPKADSRIRQNLALAIGLQGRFQEAEQVATAEIDPAQAAHNIAYLKSMLSQRNSWAEIAAQDKKKKKSGG